MASRLHLKILKLGTKNWNEWRAQNEHEKPNLVRAELSTMNLAGVDLSGALLTGARFVRANLADADLAYSDFENADLSHADLTGATLESAYLLSATLFETNLSQTNLRNTTLFGSLLNSPNLTNADLAHAFLYSTSFGRTDLSVAKGLEWANHSGPSILGFDTLSASKGLIPPAFLKGCGLADWQIQLCQLHRSDLAHADITDILYKLDRLRASRAIQVSPVFISYSRKDTNFVDAIERSFDHSGIRFWRDIHHATAGPLEKQVDRAIRVNDTVLLVLSESSVNSDWVEHEVSLARQLEKEKKKHVLCPVALDDSWKTCGWEQRLMDQLKKYNILDFSNWQDDDFFSRQFQKLKDGLQIFY